VGPKRPEKKITAGSLHQRLAWSVGEIKKGGIGGEEEKFSGWGSRLLYIGAGEPVPMMEA